MRRWPLILRFSVLCLVALAAFGVVLGYVLTSALEHNAITRSCETTAAFVSERIALGLAAADFDDPKHGADYDELDEKVRQLYLGPGVEGIRIWNTARVIVWSDDKALVGRRCPDDAALAKAFLGEASARIDRSEYAPDAPGHRPGKVLEVYAPVKLDPDGEVLAVVAIDRNADALHEDIARLNRIVWCAVVLGFGLLYAALYGTVRRGSMHIRGQARYLAQSAEQYRGLVAAAQDGIISIDRKGNLILFNNAAARMFGYDRREVIAQSVSMLMPREHRDKHVAGFRRFLETGESNLLDRTIELEGLRKNGERFPMELSLSVSGENESFLVTGFVRDVSESKLMQQRLIQTEKQASVSTVAGSFAHVLGRSITSMMGLAGLLMKDPGDSGLAEQCAREFGQQAERLKLHADNLLALDDQYHPEARLVDVGQLIDRVTRTLYIRGVLRMYSIVKDYAEDLPQVRGDEALIEQVIRNLEISASHGMADDAALTLKTQLSKDGTHVEILISGVGGGIPGDAHDRIFLPSFTTEGGDSTGLGMYIVKRVIEQHHGYTRVDTSDTGDKVMIVGLPAAS
ncbi:MAG: PAS domain S-box protein [Planctomycetes bacterium]|nr:PAS domain S-box protein [Planctomycetota bacterium]